MLLYRNMKKQNQEVSTLRMGSFGENLAQKFQGRQRIKKARK